MINEYSVVVCTTGRRSLRSAVQSALDQTLAPMEVIVSADTEEELDLPMDPRIRVIRVGPRRGANNARQAGILIASSEFVALMDDDDRWQLEKMSNQVRHVAGQLASDPYENWVSATSATVDKRGSVEIWPSDPIGPRQDFAEYMFELRHLILGRSFMQTSSFFFPVSVALQVPFSAEVQIHQDWKWLMDVRRHDPSARFWQSASPDVVYAITAGGMTSSARGSKSLDWAMAELRGESSRIRGDFVLTFPVRSYATNGDWKAVRACAREALRFGRPSALAWVHWCAWLVKAMLVRRGRRQ